MFIGRVAKRSALLTEVETAPDSCNAHGPPDGGRERLPRVL